MNDLGDGVTHDKGCEWASEACGCESRNKLRKDINSLIDFFPEGWPMPVGWNAIVEQIRGSGKKWKEEEPWAWLTKK